MKKRIIILLIPLLFSCSKGNSDVTIEDNIVNFPPIILSLTADKTTLNSGEETLITCVANDPEGDLITYDWYSFDGDFMTSKSLASVRWKAPEVDVELTFPVNVKIQSAESPIISESVKITVLPSEPEKYQLTLLPSDDAYVNSGQPDENNETSLALRTGKMDWGSGGISDYNSYFKFDLSSIPSNATITNADFKIITGNNNSNIKPHGDVYVYEVPDSNWSEETITYNNKPSNFLTPIVIEGGVIFDVEAEHSYDVTYQINRLVVFDKFSMMVNTINISKEFSFCSLYSKEVGSNYSASLFIEYVLN